MAFPRRAGPEEKAEAFGSSPSGGATATTAAAARRGREVGGGGVMAWERVGVRVALLVFPIFFFPEAFRLRQVCSVARARPFMTSRVGKT
jgi:hypothetical protein